MNIKDIEVGMYVRCENSVGEVSDIEEEIITVKYKYHKRYYKSNYFRDLKVSHNIIDVIEVGDYVNGCKVTSIDEYDDYVLYLNNRESSFESTIFSTEIKSIVTKEYFEKGKFEVE